MDQINAVKESITDEIIHKINDLNNQAWLVHDT